MCFVREKSYSWQRMALVVVTVCLGGCVAFPVRPVSKEPSASQGGSVVSEAASQRGARSRPGTKGPSSKPVPSPRQVAALRLVDHAEREINAGHYDRAIGILERAIALDGYNARAFYLLSVAWFQKGVPKRALGFAQKAELLYGKNPKGLREVCELEARIYEALGQKDKAAQYRERMRRLK